jgi:hypothetical protein
MNDTDTTTYRVFVRDWWKEATMPGWPNNLEPGPGMKSYQGHPTGLTISAARRYCKRWNATHDAGRYSRKAEFEEE